MTAPRTETLQNITDSGARFAVPDTPPSKKCQIAVTCCDAQDRRSPAMPRPQRRQLMPGLKRTSPPRVLAGVR